jgi:hypothetical protein
VWGEQGKQRAEAWKHRTGKKSLTCYLRHQPIKNRNNKHKGKSNSEVEQKPA